MTLGIYRAQHEKADQIGSVRALTRSDAPSLAFVARPLAEQL